MEDKQVLSNYQLSLFGMLQLFFNLNRLLMTLPAEHTFRKHLHTQQNTTLRTLKSYSNYNLNQFLPPTKEASQPKITYTVNRSRDKIATEPCERAIMSEYNQLLRKYQQSEEEKSNLKNQLQNIKKERNQERCEKQKKQRENQHLRQEIARLKVGMSEKRQPKLQVDRSSIGQFQLLPSYKQFYQVSVQTEPAMQQVQLSKESKQASSSQSTDTQMQHIYQKLDSLKMYKRKPSVDKPVSIGMKSDRPKATNYNWMTSNNKQNMMRASNMLDRRSGIACKYDMVRSETFDLECLPIEVGERMLDSYIDEPFL